MNRYTELRPKNGDGWGQLGLNMLRQGEFIQAQAALEKGLELAPADQFITISLGHAHLLQGRDGKARRYYQQYLPLVIDEKSFWRNLTAFEDIIDKGWSGEASRREKAWLAGQLDNYESHRKAHAKLAEAAKLRKEKQYPQAQKSVESALSIFQQYLEEHHPLTNKARRLQADIHYDQGIVLQQQRQYQQAIHFFQQALDLKKMELGEENADYAVTLSSLAIMYDELGQYAEALARYEQALAIWEKLHGPEHPDVALSLNNLAGAYRELGQYAEARVRYERALAIWKKIHGPEHPDVALGLDNLAAVYYELGQFAEARARGEQALAIREEVYGSDHPVVAKSLNTLAVVYSTLGQYAEAKVRYERALTIWEKVHGSEHPDVAFGLDNLAVVYGKLGQYAEARERGERALAIREKLHGPEHPDVALSLNNLALVYGKSGQYTEAIARYERALAIWEKFHGPEHPVVAAGLSNLAVDYGNMGQYAEARARHERALAIREKFFGPEHPDVALSLDNLGVVYLELGQHTEAKVLFERALAIALRADHPELLWNVQSSLGILYAKQNNQAAAIFFYKQTVNTLQAQRGRLKTMEKGLQQNFLKSIENSYKILADLLVTQGRLPEAQQVLDMLKESEYLHFTRRSLPVDAHTLADYNELEQQQLALLDKASEPLQVLKEPMDKLTGVKAEQQSTEQKQLLQALRDQWKRASDLFIQSLHRVERAFAQTDQENARQLAAKLKLDTDHRRLVRELGKDVLLLQYLVLEDQTRLLVTGGDRIHHVTLVLGAKALNKLAHGFYRRLKHPSQDPQPLAKELYTQLIQPIEELLERYQPKTLMLYLDGVLRYLPLGALHDGQRYLAERYALPIYTAAARKQLDIKHQEDWLIAGLGVSKEHKPFVALPAVKDELDGIVNSGGKDQQGILPGVIYLDEQFDQAALKNSLKQDYSVLHLATHFAFRPGNEKDSFLLLGNGHRLDLGSLRIDDNYRFKDLDLLTLSACETALDSPNAKGQEIEGLGTLAQKKGARGVLATLWSVADRSTGLFMRNFYRLRQEKQLSKSEALRQAQLLFIQGKEAKLANPKQKPGLQLDGKREQRGRKISRGYSHPFYWAPFILMGNWL